MSLHLTSNRRMIELLEQLVNIPSVSGHEKDVGRFLIDYLQNLSFSVSRQAVDSDRFNVLATTGTAPHVLLCTHIDTVAPFFPFRRQGEICYGRGVCDAKGQIVAMLSAGQQLRSNGIDNFAFLFVVDEENVSAGAKKAAALDLDSSYVIIGEPTQNKMVSGQKGVLVYRVKATGTGGHSSQPERGISAIHQLIQFLQTWINKDWGESAEFGHSRVNVGRISGGSGNNVLAHDAAAEGIFRVATSLIDIHKKMQPIPQNIQIEILSEYEPQCFHTLPGFETTTVGFGTDAAYLRNLGDMLLLGPGSIHYAHCLDEQITKQELEKAATLYVDMVKQLV